MTRERGTLRRAVRLLGLDTRRVLLAVLTGTLALGCAVALAAVSAWLIARASQMPPVLQLSIATVAVRTFGIGRGVLRYVDRLVSHDVALRGMTNLRTTLYTRLAAGRSEATLRVRRGDLLARVGADVDAVGDVVVRGLLPAGVALLLGIGTVTAMAFFWPPAAVALAACLVLAGVVAPLLAARGARASERRAVTARADASAAALAALDDAGPLLVAGGVGRRVAELRDADRRLARAVDAGAASSAVAAGLGILATGLAATAALVTGIPAVVSGALAPVELAVIVLTPLAAFEATGMLPAAAVSVQRSRAAAARILALLDSAAPDAEPRGTAEPPAATSRPPVQFPELSVAIHDPNVRKVNVGEGAGIVARGLDCGWPGLPPVLRGVDLDVAPGRSVAIVGPSGAGKTTLLLTLAGLLPRAGGTLLVDGDEPTVLDPAERAARVVVTAEDAHVFGTTVLENLRVARGDVTPDEATAALTAAGLQDWLAALPDGLDTMLGPDARTVSGGERRRLLLARALLAPAPLLLVDEPAEHLDPATADALVTSLLAGPRTPAGGPRGVVVVTHRLTPLAAADEVLWVESGRIAARGTHAELSAGLLDYGEAVRRERVTADHRERA
ncbi:MAG: thiol reductant ABC exporter subunit CydC [Cellulomonas sp. 73-92]|uniref:thiol reductant ABC exporter subunit CydC n=1 Tax=Cellulomonas sp. 73-92 TaxID=1895740 RepID=UPI000925CDB6|nr:thiol reductant ABC exporter subunit CydC [Cellulomonas sp. 73-92]OJV74993.1 MAG: thiol reductant ABC exporter subunit CydC [Cellulomonas sp. 73-92]